MTVLNAVQIFMLLWGFMAVCQTDTSKRITLETVCIKYEEERMFIVQVFSRQRLCSVMLQTYQRANKFFFFFIFIALRSVYYIAYNNFVVYI